MNTCRCFVHPGLVCFTSRIGAEDAGLLVGLGKGLDVDYFFGRPSRLLAKLHGGRVYFYKQERP